MRLRSVLAFLVILPVFVAWVEVPPGPSTDDPGPERLHGVWARGPDAEREVWWFRDDGTGQLRRHHDAVARTRTFRYTVDGDRVRVQWDADGAVLSATLAVTEDYLQLGQVASNQPQQVFWRLEDDGAYPSVYAAYGSWDGAAFHQYHMLSTTYGGRGTGWYHTGTAQDWTSERFDYQVDHRHMAVHFPGRTDDAHAVFRIRGTSALYRKAGLSNAAPCAYAYVRAPFSQWVAGVVQPYDDSVGADRQQAHEAHCRDRRRGLAVR